MHSVFGAKRVTVFDTYILNTSLYDSECSYQNHRYWLDQEDTTHLICNRHIWRLIYNILLLYNNKYKHTLFRNAHMQNTLSINSFFFITANMLYTLELIVKAIEAKRFSQQNM